MVANPGILRPSAQNTPETEQPVLVAGSPRGTLWPASLARRSALPPSSADRDFLDYADFVLDQEAQYCQQ